MSNNKNEKLKNCKPEEIVEELFQRQNESTGDSLAKNKRAFTQYSSKALHKELIDRQKLIYGVDNRQDLWEVEDQKLRELADSVVGIIDVSDLKDNGDGTSTISTISFGEAQGLCNTDTESFYSQPTAPSCSGFLVAGDIIATAGHCVNKNTLPRLRFVFGFHMINEAEARVVIPNEDIFRGISIIDREEESNGADFALVKLERPVIGHSTLKVRRSGKIDDKQKVFVIGHPSGLPLKIARDAHVRENSEESFFVANLDTYGGNSGSPVFNENDRVVEGILVRGATDFIKVDGCYRSNVCSTNGCRGEDITRTTEFADHIQKNTRPSAPKIEIRVANLERSVKSVAEDIKLIKNKIA